MVSLYAQEYCQYRVIISAQHISTGTYVLNFYLTKVQALKLNILFTVCDKAKHGIVKEQ